MALRGLETFSFNQTDTLSLSGVRLLGEGFTLDNLSCLFFSKAISRRIRRNRNRAHPVAVPTIVVKLSGKQQQQIIGRRGGDGYNTNEVSRVNDILIS